MVLESGSPRRLDCAEAGKVTDEQFLSLVQQKFPRHVEIKKFSKQVRLKGPAWEYLREFVLNRERGRCQKCRRVLCLHDEGNPWAVMDGSHIKSKGSGGHDLPGNLEALCRICHSKSHNCNGKPLQAKAIA